jgi:signal recognition particle receptor subunit beta
MAFVNYNNKEITVKIVYYGPALSGKTTCLKYIYSSGEYRKKGKLITLDTDGDRTLFFDFLPIEIGKLGDYSIKMQLYTVPGQVAYNTTRKLVLQGSDGIVFVADSQVVMRDQNADSFNNLKENLKANNITYEETPLILQFNKRDLKEILPLDILNKDLNPENKAFFPTVGTSGENVLEALHTIMKIVIIHLKNKLSIFQKDKTVMFSRDEVTDSVAKKSQKKAEAKSHEPVFEYKQPKSEEVEEDVSRREADTEKEEIFELSSPLMDEPLKTRDYPKHKPDEDIFNLGDESRLMEMEDAGDGTGVGAAEEELEIPEVVLMDELKDEKESEVSAKKTRAANSLRSPSGKTGASGESAEKQKEEEVEPFEDIEELGKEYELQPEDIVIEPEQPSPLGEDFEEAPRAGINKAAGSGARYSLSGLDIPIHVEIPEDKDEIKINLNLRIVIKRKT